MVLRAIPQPPKGGPTDLLSWQRWFDLLRNNLNQLLGGGAILQTVTLFDGEHATGGNVTPNDDTIPQQTGETNIFMSLSITPTSATSILEIESNVMCISNSGDVIMGLWVDSTENALATSWGSPRVNSAFEAIPLTHRVVAGSTTARTYKIGVGPTAAATVQFNGISGARRLGGTLASFIKITEFAP